MERLVPANKIEKDPRNLPYLFPSMPLTRYAKIINQYINWKLLALAEDIARIEGKRVIPSQCLHWERKKKYEDKSIRIARRSFYLMDEDELTDLEWEKYRSFCEKNTLFI